MTKRHVVFGALVAAAFGGCQLLGGVTELGFDDDPTLCASPNDCAPGASCGPEGTCVPDTCHDGARDGDESDSDCGGSSCRRCDDGESCVEAGDCASLVCVLPAAAGGAGGSGSGGASAGAGGASGALGVCAPCVRDDDCAALGASYCKGGTCALAKPDGEGCAAGNECASGFCPAADGVCCDAACDASCSACLASKTGGANGHCLPVAGGTDPDAECADAGAASCGARGSGCNGESVAPGCTRYPSGTPCVAAACAAGFSTAERQCDGAGVCVAAAPVACAPYACDAAGVQCLVACTTSLDCAPGDYCDANQHCEPQKPLGSSCGSNDECASGACPSDDGICCDSACGSGCQACLFALTGAPDGSCASITAGLEQDGECGATPPTSCGARGTGCNGAALAPACELWDGSTTCSPASCVAGVALPAASCDGDGSCASVAPVACAPYACNASATACRTSCNGDTECAASAYCNAAHACVAKGDNGTTCGAPNQCTSGFCPAADGVCCDSACTGTCRSCAAAKSDGPNGSCDFVSAGTDPDNECLTVLNCNGSGSCL